VDWVGKSFEREGFWMMGDGLLMLDNETKGCQR